MTHPPNLRPLHIFTPISLHQPRQFYAEHACALPPGDSVHRIRPTTLVAERVFRNQRQLVIAHVLRLIIDTRRVDLKRPRQHDFVIPRRRVAGPGAPVTALLEVRRPARLLNIQRRHGRQTSANQADAHLGVATRQSQSVDTHKRGRILRTPTKSPAQRPPSGWRSCAPQ